MPPMKPSATCPKAGSESNPSRSAALTPTLTAATLMPGTLPRKLVVELCFSRRLKKCPIIDNTPVLPFMVFPSSCDSLVLSEIGEIVEIGVARSRNVARNHLAHPLRFGPKRLAGSKVSSEA